MLSVWKKAWKKDHSAAATDSESNDQDHQPSGTSWPEASVDAVPAVPLQTGEGSLDSIISSPPLKRRKVDLLEDASSAIPERPLKRRRDADVPRSDSASITGSRPPQMSTLVTFPEEMTVLYEPYYGQGEGSLTKQLRAIDPVGIIARPWFRYAGHVMRDLGSYGSDLVWRYALKNPDQNEVSRRVHGSYASASLAARSVDDNSFRQVIQSWKFTGPIMDPSSQCCSVTNKFIKLVQILVSFQACNSDFRCIVFVQRRITALVLVDMLLLVRQSPEAELGFIQPQALYSHGSQQQKTIRSFSARQCNLLVATKSMEDLDLPQVDVVIRFDLFESQVSYAYSLAHLRGSEAHLIHMVENGNDVHHRVLSALSPKSDAMKTWMMGISSQGVCPPDDIHESTDPYRSDDEEADDLGPCITDPCTSGRIYHRDATATLRRFLAKDSSQRERNSAIFHLRRLDDSETKYVCSIRLLGDNPHIVMGEPCDSVAHARRSACFNACRELAESGSLDYRSMPRSRYPVGIFGPECLPLVANKANGTRRYPRKSPDFWSNCLSKTWVKLFPTVVTVGDANASWHAPMVLLTRLPLPSLSSTKLFYTGVPVTVHFSRGAPFTLDEEKLQQAHAYTMRVCRGVMNKVMECPLQSVSYLFLPLSAAWCEDHAISYDSTTLPNLQEYIPWDLVETTGQKHAIPLKCESVQDVADDVQDAILQDRWVEFTRRYEVDAVRSDMSPLSVPIDSPREAGYTTFLEYCKDRRNKGYEELKNYTQPLVQVKRLTPVLNRLNPTSRPLTESTKATAKYLIPEMCAKFIIPASTLRTALMLPSITRRIDDMLLVKELNAKLFNHCLREDLLQIALTTPSAGFEFDYERLELLGDAYLKYLSSVYLFVTDPRNHEGALHAARQKIISNKALLECADTVGLAAFIQSKPFVVKMWQLPALDALEKVEQRFRAEAERQDMSTPTAISQPGQPGPTSKPSKRRRQQEDQHVHWLGEKSVADVAEAIIGAGYMTGGRDAALAVTKALNIPVPRIDRWSDFSRKGFAVAPQAVAQLKPGSIEAVEKIVGHKFERPEFLAQALTHTSVQGHDMVSYERLEFLGDAILDFMVIRHLYYREAQLSPGGLTLLKGAMVSNAALAAVCVRSGLHQHLLISSRELERSIQTYEAQLKEKQDEEYALAQQEGRSPGQYWLDMEPPKALSDVVESVIGAIYISDKFSPVGSETFFVNVLEPFYDKHIRLSTLSHHPTKILFELFQAESCHDFQMLKQQVHSDSTLEGRQQHMIRCEVIVHDTVLAAAESTTTLTASRLASFFALDALEGDPDFMKRTCDCRLQSQTRQAVKKALKDMWKDDGADDDEVEAVLGLT